MKKLLALFISLIALIHFCYAENSRIGKKMNNQQVEINTNMGSITIELRADKAPKTVENFLSYVKEGFYDGTVFHRVIKGFMIQGGGYDTNFREKNTRAPIKNEANNGLKNEIGTIAMARTSDPDSATAQFFINVANNSFLNFEEARDGYGYCVFGKVTKGMDVVNKIAALPTGPARPFPSDVPQQKVVIESVKPLETVGVSP